MSRSSDHYLLAAKGRCRDQNRSRCLRYSMESGRLHAGQMAARCLLDRGGHPLGPADRSAPEPRAAIRTQAPSAAGSPRPRRALPGRRHDQRRTRSVCETRIEAGGIDRPGRPPAANPMRNTTSAATHSSSKVGITTRCGLTTHRPTCGSPSCGATPTTATIHRRSGSGSDRRPRGHARSSTPSSPSPAPTRPASSAPWATARRSGSDPIASTCSSTEHSFDIVGRVLSHRTAHRHHEVRCHAAARPDLAARTYSSSARSSCRAASCWPPRRRPALRRVTRHPAATLTVDG
jgi:hypothetical protein